MSLKYIRQTARGKVSPFLQYQLLKTDVSKNLSQISWQQWYFHACHLPNVFLAPSHLLFKSAIIIILISHCKVNWIALILKILSSYNLYLNIQYWINISCNKYISPGVWPVIFVLNKYFDTYAKLKAEQALHEYYSTLNKIDCIKNKKSLTHHLYILFLFKLK
jgi:hypothetical protein